MNSADRKSSVNYLAIMGIALILVCSAFVTRTVTSQSSGASTLSAEETAFLDEVAEKTWNYLTWAVSNHLPWSWRSETIAGGDYVNPAEIGLYMVSYLGAYDLRQNWSPTKADTVAEVSAVLDQLRMWQTDQPQGSNAYNNSLFFQWYHVNANPPAVGPSNGDQVVPSIDNALLAASLITIREWAERNNAPALAQKADTILQDMDFRLWYDSNQHQFKLGDTRNPQGGVYADYYSNENRIINFVARAMGQMTPAEYAISLQALAQPSATYDRGTADLTDDITVEKAAWDGSFFTYGGPALFIRESITAYGITTLETATEAQIRYAQDRGYQAWGLSDCFDVGAGGYVQQGAPPTGGGTPETRPGLVTPHASGLALVSSYNREAVMNLQTLSNEFPAVYHDDYGFKESVMTLPSAPGYGEVSERFSALAQEWLFLAFVNQKTGFIQRYMYQDQGVIAAHNEMFGQNFAPSASNAAPIRNYFFTSTLPIVTWNAVGGVSEYELQVDNSQAFALPLSYTHIFPASMLSATVPGLSDGKFYWRVRGRNGNQAGKWSSTDVLVVDNPSG